MSMMTTALAQQAARERQAIAAHRAEVLRMQRERGAEADGSTAPTAPAPRRSVFARAAERLHLAHARPATH